MQGLTGPFFVRVLRRRLSLQPGEPEEDAIDIMLKLGGDGVKSSNLLNIGTLLHCATSIDGPGQNALVDFLLQHGFDANAPADGDGARPLHSAW